MRSLNVVGVSLIALTDFISGKAVYKASVFKKAYMRMPPVLCQLPLRRNSLALRYQ